MTKLPTMRYLSLGSKVLGVCAQFFILEKQHASTTCSDGFVSIKANSTHLSECTGMATFIKTADTFGCVFNQFDIPLTEDITFFTEPADCKSNYWLNAVVLKDKAAQLDFLEYTNDHGVMTRPVWELMNRLPMFEHCETDGLENTEWLADRVVNIPSSVRLDK